jgi:hypothetical protein
MTDGMEAGFCSCEWDGEPSEWFELRIRKARKEWKCCECGAPIHIGERYEYIVGKWEGRVDDYQTCLTCSQIRNDYCAPLTMLRETIWEGLGVDYLGEWPIDKEGEI